MKKIWGIFLLILLFLPLVSAEDYSFSVVPSDEEVSLCNFESKELYILLENDGDFPEVYGLSVKSPRNVFTAVSSDTVELAPGEKARVAVLVEVLDANPGEYTFSIFTTPNESPFEGITTIDLLINDCFDFTADLTTLKSGFCSGTDESLEVVIENTGSAADVFRLDIKDNPSWISLSSTEVNLSSTDSKTVNIVVNPSFDVTGHYEYELKVDGFDQIATIPLEWNIRECKSALVESNSTGLRVCRDMVSKIPFSVRNMEGSSSNVSISLDGAPSWVSSDKNSLTVPANGSVNSFLKVKPSNDSKKSEFTLNALDSSFPGQSSMDFVVNLKSNRECISKSNESTNLLTALFSWIFSPAEFDSESLFDSPNKNVNESEENISNEEELEEELENITGLDIEIDNGTTNKTNADLEAFLAGLAVQDKEEEPPTNLLIKYRWALVIAFAIILILIILFRLDSFSKIFEFFSSEKAHEDDILLKEFEEDEELTIEEEPEEEKPIKKEEPKAQPVQELQPSKLGKVLFLIIALAIIIFLVFKFIPSLGGLDFFYTFRSYLIVGAAAGIVLALILHFRESIINFFEEEEDEKEEDKKLK